MYTNQEAEEGGSQQHIIDIHTRRILLGHENVLPQFLKGWGRGHVLATPIIMAFFVSLLLSDNSWDFAYHQYFTIKSTLKLRFVTCRIYMHVTKTKSFSS